jgi:hypothetical protein
VIHYDYKNRDSQGYVSQIKRLTYSIYISTQYAIIQELFQLVVICNLVNIDFTLTQRILVFYNYNNDSELIIIQKRTKIQVVGPKPQQLNGEVQETSDSST